MMVSPGLGSAHPHPRHSLVNREKLWLLLSQLALLLPSLAQAGSVPGPGKVSSGLAAWRAIAGDEGGEEGGS